MDNRNYYQTNGYLVCRNLVPTDLIDRLVSLYKEQIVPSKEPFHRQMSNRREPNEFNEFGYVKQDFLDVHNYEKFPEFSTAVKDILCSDAIQNTLKEITDSNSLNMMQSLFFDLNRETLAHHDAYYLDSDPAGRALAVWIPLEDLDERAGKFYVVPKSTDVEVQSSNHWEWMSNMHKYFEENLKDKIAAPDLNKGDAIFWNARIIHGALPILDQKFSMKHLTAHFIPAEYKYQTPFMSKNYVELEPHKGVKIYTATTITSDEWFKKQMADGAKKQTSNMTQ